MYKRHVRGRAIRRGDDGMGAERSKDGSFPVLNRGIGDGEMRRKKLRVRVDSVFFDGLVIIPFFIRGNGSER